MNSIDYFSTYVGSSNWFAVLKSFYYQQQQGGAKEYISKNATFARRAVYQPNVKALSIGDADIVNAVLSNLQNNHLPIDANGIYNVFFRGDFNYSGWNVNWCSAHMLLQNVSGRNLKVSIVGDPDTAPMISRACNPGFQQVSSSETPGVSTMATYYAHELANIVTDFDKNAWYFNGYNPNGNEVAGLCNWDFGAITNNANIWLGPQHKPFLLEKLFQPGFGCTLSPGNSASGGDGNSNSQGGNSGVRPVDDPTPMPVTMPTISPALAFDLDYHETGEVMVYPVGFINIFLGEFNDRTKELVYYFSTNIGNSAWFNVLTSYYQLGFLGDLEKVTNVTYFAGNASLWSTSKEINLQENDIESIIAESIFNGTVYLDSNSIYGIFFRGDFNVSFRGKFWLKDWCSLRGAFRLPSLDVIRYVLIGDPSTTGFRDGSPCIPLYSRKTANENVGADSIVVAYAEQIANTVTDGLQNSWYSDVSGQEAGSACEGDFDGIDLSDPQAKNFNLQLGTVQFLVQNIWQPGKGCTSTILP